MANSFQALTSFLLISTLCLLSLLGSSHGTKDSFVVEGQVYCDTCRAQFMTRLSELMPGAKVRLECRNRDKGSITYSIEDETDKSGTYQLQVEGDHEDDDCEISLVKSSIADCDEISRGGWGDSSKLSLTFNDGMTTSTRQANPIGFLKKEPLKECPTVFKELGIPPPTI